MTRAAAVVCVALVFLGLACAAAAADDLRCGNSLVGNGDSRGEVRADCGEPDYIDRWERLPPNHGIPEIETWVYNFGQNQLLSLLRFRNGRLASIATDGYGFRTPGPRDCQPNDIRPGMSKYRLLEWCGEPQERESVILHRPLRHDGLKRLFAPVRRETWLYNFGTSRLMREVTIENGFVREVDTAGRGH